MSEPFILAPYSNLWEFELPAKFFNISKTDSLPSFNITTNKLNSFEFVFTINTF